MRNKKGQFYFVSALVIILIIISFIVLNNQFSKSKNTELKDIKEELNIEIERFLEYGANSNLTDNEMQDLFLNFSLNYILKLGENKNTVFMFGKENGNLILKGHMIEDSENISIETGSSIVNISEGAFEETITTAGSDITLTSGSHQYVFDLLEGQNFYYFITKEYKGEKQIIKG